jgi:type IV pilus assembly protein PilC
MATYKYEALDSAGKPASGTVEAESSEDAIQQIRGQGFFPTSVREGDGGGGKKGLLGSRGKSGDKKKQKAKKEPKGKDDKEKKGIQIKIPAIGKVNIKILTQFTRQLSTLQDAGLPLLRSLQILQQQAKPGQLKNILTQVVSDVEAGSTLSDAFARHPKGFDRLYCKMVAAGEVGGVLDVILQRLANFMEKAARLRSRIKGAMIYPTVVVIVAVAIVTGIMYFVIPKFEEIFEDFDITLPGLTQFLIDASSWVAGKNDGQMVPGWLFIVSAPFFIFVFLKFFRKTDFGRAAIDWTALKVPVIGELVEKTTVARFTRTLGTLVSAGVPILEAVNITRDTCGNWVFERALQRVHDSIREGESFAVPLRESKVVDGIVVNMIDVGEETGDLDVMLMKVADNYDEEVDVAVQALLSLIEPMLVVVLGTIVGGIVLALFMPLVKMIQSVSESN